LGNVREVLLQTDGAATLGIVSAIDNINNIVTAQHQPFGTRLLSTPSGRLMFQIIGAMAEFERALIQERVRAGLQNARAKGRRLGRPRVIVDASRIASLRAQGRSWAQIVAETGASKGTAQRALVALPKIG
jgi:DNA invertase Pin-like site-specific DNA recombinase